MRDTINYIKVHAGTEEFARLQRFAESFDHEIRPHPNISVYAHYRGDICFGYSDHVFMPTIYPAFHPAVTRPRDVIQVMADWKAHCQLSGSHGYLGVPLNNDDGKGHFPQEVMEKLGLQRMHRELYLPHY